jgi:hypothetical protein
MIEVAMRMESGLVVAFGTARAEGRRRAVMRARIRILKFGEVEVGIRKTEYQQTVSFMGVNKGIPHVGKSE